VPGIALRKNKVPYVESSLSKPVSWRYFTEKLHDKDRQGRLPVCQRKRTRFKKNAAKVRSGWLTCHS
jgi:hypothetical protein